MPYETLSALALFAFVTSITPGPNNMMLLSSGANFGFIRTLPHMLGIALGFSVMVVLVGLGLMQIFDLLPATYVVLKVVSLAYLLWLAWKIAVSGRPETAGKSASPMTFIQAALFQWVNPKAWTMALGAITLYAPNRDLISVLLVGAIFGLVNFPSVSIWTVLGQQLQRFLSSPRRLQLFNWSMAFLLMASLWPNLMN
ncbi:LysE family translocator [Cognatishimia sp. WU-CL00825]|uniref:LysE family translocator n=1 Tax=Cognatishimia sp. WU-CL00825 TaxID=3127658 RepID=UPI00310925A7